MVRACLLVYNHVLPLPLFALLWWNFSGGHPGSIALPALLLGVPLALGYVFPILGVRYARLWRFKSRLAVFGFFPHHGFIYSSTLAGGLWAVNFCLPQDPSWQQRTIASLLLGAGTGFVGWLHDTLAARDGLIELRTPIRLAGASAHESVFEYGPATFFVLGASYGAMGLQAMAWARASGIHHPVWLFVAGLGLLAGGSSLLFIRQNRHAIPLMVSSLMGWPEPEARP
jgi:hypothetical protein